MTGAASQAPTPGDARRAELLAVRDGMDPRTAGPASDRFELAGEANERLE